MLTIPVLPIILVAMSPAANGSSPNLSQLRISDADRAASPASPSRRGPAGVLLGVGVGVLLTWFGRDALVPQSTSGGARPVGETALAVAGPAESSAGAPPASTALGSAGSIMAGGRVESASRRELVFAQAGVVSAIKVSRGQQVKAGQVLMELESSAERAAVREQEAALETARTRLAELAEGARPEELEQARRDVEAATALAADADEKAAQAARLAQAGSIAKSQSLESQRAAEAARARAQAAQARLALVGQGSRRTSVASAQSEVVRAQAALSKTLAKLQYTRLLAPVDGTVVDVRVETGEATAPDQRAPVVLSDLNRLQVKVDVPEAKATRVRVGDVASIIVEALPDTRFHGRVSEIGLEADRQKGSLEVTISFDAGSDLAAVRPRMAARATLDVGRAKP